MPVAVRKRTVSRASSLPRTASLDVTYRCNLRCVHCNVSCLRADRRPELDADEFDDLFRQLVDLGVKEVLLTGGELLVRDDWERIARAACDSFSVGLFTNAVAVTDAVAARLRRLPLDLIIVSIYGASQMTYEAVTGVAGSFSRFQSGLERLRATGRRVVPTAVLLRENAHEWPEILRQYGSWPGFVWSARVSPRFDGGKQPTAHRVTDPQLLDILRSENHRGKKTRRAPTASAHCSSGGFALSAHGDMFPCNMMPLSGGNVRETSIREIWNGALFREVRGLRMKDMAKCTDCEVQPYCTPCPGMNRLETGDMRRPSDAQCREARLRHALARLHLTPK